MDKAVKTIFFFVAVIIVIVFAGNMYFSDFLTPQGGIFLSKDSGTSWQRFGALSTGGKITNIDSIEIINNPKDSRILYWGTLGKGIFKSIDSGNTWHKLSDANAVLDPRANVYSIAVDPNLPDYQNKIPDRFYLGVLQNGSGKVLKTIDGGLSFKEVYVSSKQNATVYSVKIDPRNPNIIWAGTSDGLLLKSKDYGETWKLSQEFGTAINSIILNPSSTSQMFIGTFSGGIFSSSDGGVSWIDESDGLKDYQNSRYLEKIIIDPWGNLYIASRFGLLKSSDWGINWKAVSIVFPDDALPVLDVAFGKSQKDLYVSASNLVFNTKDGGEFWQIRKLGTTKRVKALYINKDSGVILAGAGQTNSR
jgi:photosystem II stability/assembly factor-like uncharacterized protein